MPRFDHDGIELAYDEHGPADGNPVVLLHGLSLDRHTWHRLVPHLTQQHRVFTLDQRGHGESAHAPGTYELAHYGADAEAFCERVVGRPAVLVGHSLGGVVAFHVARTRLDLVRGVLLEDPPLYRGESPAGAPDGVAAFFPVLRDLLRGLRERRATLEEYEEILRRMPAMNGNGTMADVLGEAGTTINATAWRRLDPETFTPAIEGSSLAGSEPSSSLACPVVVVRADASLRAAFTDEDAERFLVTNPHATVIVASGASHAVHDEQPDTVRQALLALLADVG